MQFPHYYFEDEVREGFYIPSMIKCSWAAQLEVLEDVVKVCKKHNISYFVTYGTLLGAVRHGGFIPWDDDMDICMTRPDYNQFMAVAEKELPKGYDLLDVYHESEWPYRFARIINNRGIRVDQPFLEKFHGFPFVAGLDIFPLDYLPSDDEEVQFLISLVGPILQCTSLVDDKYVDQDELEEQICSIEELCNVKIDRNRPLKNELSRLAERLCAIYREEESERIALTPEWVKNPKVIWPKDYYKETVLVPFEGIKVSAPAEYDGVLKGMYGEYMRVVYDCDEDHEYPFYKKQESVLYQCNNRFPSRYKFHIEDFCESGCSVAETLLQIKNRVSDNKNGERTERKQMVFFPYRVSGWNRLESVWKAAVEDPDCDVYVVPIPYFDKKWDGSLGEMHYDGDGFPDYVSVIRYDEFHLEEHHPDMIYMQFPYDEHHYTIGVEPSFYARNLIKYTDKLIYIPYFVVDEIASKNQKALENAKTFINVPGVFYADRVIVQSENMRQVYIDTLAEFAGEDTRKIWEDKIFGVTQNGSGIYSEI